MNTREPLEAAIVDVANFLSKNIMLTLKGICILTVVMLGLIVSLLHGALREKKTR